MGRFNDRRSGGNRSFGGGGGGNRRFGGGGGGRGMRDGERPRMYGAICSDCGVECEVPFKPTDSKPVYCSDCFESGDNRENRRNDRGGDRRGSDRRGGDRGGFGGRRDRGDRPMFDAVCDGCGENCQVPFQPTSGKPIYCDNCFTKDRKDNRGDRRKSGGGSDNSGLKRDIDMINVKLDAIMTLLSGKKAISNKSKVKDLEKKPSFADASAGEGNKLKKNSKKTFNAEVMDVVDELTVQKKGNKKSAVKKETKKVKVAKAKTAKKAVKKAKAKK